MLGEHLRRVASPALVSHKPAWPKLESFMFPDRASTRRLCGCMDVRARVCPEDWDEWEGGGRWVDTSYVFRIGVDKNASRQKYEIGV